MSGSMYAAISGLNADQSWLGVISENIANVSTVGYKDSSMTFAQALQQTLSGASSPTATSGGIDPVQVAAGGAVNIGGIQINTSEGSLQSTGINTNLAIQGNGYFLVKTPQGGIAYTRAGNFSLDANGTLVDPNGDQVLGWSATNVASKQQTLNTLAPLSIPSNMSMAPVATTNIQMSGNLNVADTTPVSVPVTVYDSLGNQQQLDLELVPPSTTSSSGNSWTVYVTSPQNATASYTAGTTPNGWVEIGTLNFSSSGTLNSASGSPAGFVATSSSSGTIQTNPSTVTASWSGSTGGGTLTVTPADGASPITIQLNTADFANLTNFAESDTATATANGNAAGTMQNFTIGSNGTITGSFSNGQTEVLGQVALAGFSNPGGLLNIGQNLWQQSPNSGTPLVGQPSTGALGSLAAGELEGSNVSLANEFVNMIMAQQGYQANAKVITVDQQLRNTLVNMIQ